MNRLNPYSGIMLRFLRRTDCYCARTGSTLDGSGQLGKSHYPAWINGLEIWQIFLQRHPAKCPGLPLRVCEGCICSLTEERKCQRGHPHSSFISPRFYESIASMHNFCSFTSAIIAEVFNTTTQCKTMSQGWIHTLASTQIRDLWQTLQTLLGQLRGSCFIYGNIFFTYWHWLGLAQTFATVFAQKMH